MNYVKADEVMEAFFELLFSKYPIGLEKSMKGSGFIFDFTYCIRNAA